MREVGQREIDTVVRPRDTTSALTTDGLVAGWREDLSIVNLRGNAEEVAFRQRAASALGVALPLKPCTTSENSAVRVVWVGPDDWFIIGPQGHAEAMASRLREAMSGLHHAVTEASSGYTVLHLSGTPVRDVLAQGCPLDLHPRAFERGACAGSHFFKASVWLWQTDEAPVYELLVARSYMDYVWLMLERASAECGLVRKRFG
ncbi:MAG: sarcosine oxidase subunit gamma family protein [Betaproteobacteria bacterium]